MKSCTRCSISKPLSEYHKRKIAVDGRKSHCKECANALNRKDYNPEYKRIYNLRTKYGITAEQYTTMYESQEGCCKICSRAQEDEYYRLCVDHCHDTGLVRGLLCTQCNKAIGLLYDDAKLVSKALDYLNETQK